MKRRAGGWPLAALGGVLALYLLAPLAYLLASVVSPATLPGLSDPLAQDALRTSVAAASVATVVMAALGVPLGYVLARGRFAGRNLLTAALMVPLVFPPVVSGILLLSLFGPYGVVGRWFADHGWELDSSFAGIVLAQVFVAAPFVVVAARSAFGAVDPALGEVAATLGAGRLRTFWRVDLPQAWAGVAAGIALAWLRALGEYGATVVLAYHPYTLPVYTFVQLSASGGVAATLPLALLALGASVAVLALVGSIDALTRRLRRSARGAPPSEAADGKPAAPPLAIPGAGATLRATVGVTLGDFTLDAGLDAPPGVTVILGPSGAGKSLLLRCLAGLGAPHRGTIALGDATFFAAGAADWPPADRQLGYVPQGYALFGHLSVAGNVAFGLRGLDAGERQARVGATLAALRIGDLATRPAGAVSGGQAQRVALARALVIRPRALLLDEPFSAIDPPVRRALRRELRELWRAWDIPILLVTHDLADARALADHLVILDAGRVLRAGPRDAVLGDPGSARAASLLGLRNVLPAAVLAATPDTVTLRCAGLDFAAALAEPTAALAPGQALTVALAPGALALHTAPHPGAHPGMIIGTEPADGVTLAQVQVGTATLEVAARDAECRTLTPGAAVWVGIPPAAVTIIARET